ncbi:MAG: polyamine aminopropyltransferase 2 [Chlorobiota bacterium]
MKRSNLLKVCLFATGLSGIVAEYILSTLAAYFLGDSVIQWTLIVSLMLFSMGAGSSLSKYIRQNLLEKFIMIEFTLSIATSFSAITVYSLSAFPEYRGLVIYSLAIFIGLLIGLEIPIVTRLNEEFEELRVNIANVLEKDYYGSLAGGIFFAFVGLPVIGLTYTPFILGTINFAVALALYLYLRDKFKYSKLRMNFTITGVILLLASGVIFAKPIIKFSEQLKYLDQIVYEEQSKYQKIVITRWKDFHWLYLNNSVQFSTYDEAMYHEPLVQIPLYLSGSKNKVLILGGGDGCAAREALNFSDVQSITLVDIDPAMTRMARENEIVVSVNDSSLHNPRVKIVNRDAFNFLEESSEIFDVIIADFPDPRNSDLARLYSQEFYTIVLKHLSRDGIFITQAGSPYFAYKAYSSIDTTLKVSGFNTLRMRNHVPTMGEWGYIIASASVPGEKLRTRFLNLKINEDKTRWLTTMVLPGLISFGKQPVPTGNEIEVNTLKDPVIHRYFEEGDWGLY